MKKIKFSGSCKPVLLDSLRKKYKDDCKIPFWQWIIQQASMTAGLNKKISKMQANNSAIESAFSLKRQCHSLFDPLWEKEKTRDKKQQKRDKLYYELSTYLGVKQQYAHFSVLNKEQLMASIEFLKTFY